MGLVARFARKPFDLRRKVVLITGGSRGLGLLLAREVARHGEAAKGHQSQSRWSPSVLTALSERAAARNNEL